MRLSWTAAKGLFLFHQGQQGWARQRQNHPDDVASLQVAVGHVTDLIVCGPPASIVNICRAYDEDIFFSETTYELYQNMQVS